MSNLPELADDPLRRAIRTLAHADEHTRVAALLAEADAAPGDGETVAAEATSLVEAIRERLRYRSGVESLLNTYSLSSREGVVLMCLAEALLRIPDATTADRLIADRLASGDWRGVLDGAEPLFVNASAWGLLLTGKLVRLRESADESAWTLLRQTLARVGEPAIRTAMRLAMRIMGAQFVLATDIAAALQKSAEWRARGYRHSYDMLGEGARCAADAHRYFLAYHAAIEAVGRSHPRTDTRAAPGVSVKLSALHPRLELAQIERLRAELLPRLIELATLAARHGIGLTVDAEESYRLDIALELFAAAFEDPRLAGWDGFGIAVQAYQKSAPAVIDWLDELARRHHRRLPVRLVKGAYWDTEIRHAQLEGLATYPVFTRKASTDVCYLVCAARLLARRERLFPQFATHNAHTAAAVLALAGDPVGFEFQRLHGMGEELYEELLERRGAGVPCRIYAPVGEHAELLAYLVRRLLENGANSSFVHNLADDSLGSAALAADPRTRLRGLSDHANRAIPPPPGLYGARRRNSRGIDLRALDPLADFVRALDTCRASAARLGNAAGPGRIAVRNPADRRDLLGHYAPASPQGIEAAAQAAHAAASRWAATTAAERAACLRRAADLLEQALAELAGFCVREAGRTLHDAVADVREAIDFCRYYAAGAEELFARHGTGLAARGPLLCISPWNFPVAIFTGQVAAALVCGNPVIAKPAEQTTLVALRVSELFHAAGVPPEVLQVLAGPGAPIGERLLPDPRIAGVLFTGSTDVARDIATALARRGGARALLVAETGGQNAMIVDSSALLEQVVDDVIASAFGSAGQRCSALRVLYVQREVADRLIHMLAGAMNELRIGDPAQCGTDIGPLIDERARERLREHVRRLEATGRRLHACTLSAECDEGSFFPPQVFGIASIAELPREVFGPVLHLIRCNADEIDALPAHIGESGYGLTFGIHSRIQSRIARLAREIEAGNVYVNRSMIGAVVGVQPFGGRGLSGTGPKAGGPHYLGRLLRPASMAAPAWRALPAADTKAPAPAFECRPLVETLRAAWRDWRRREPSGRLRPGYQLQRLVASDPYRDHEAREALALAIRQLLDAAANTLLPRRLAGATGETCTLYAEGRGVLVCAARLGAAEADLLLPALAALLAGNAVLLLVDEAVRTVATGVRNLLGEAGFPDALGACHVVSDPRHIVGIVARADIDGVACHRDPALSQRLEQALALRTGPLLALIDEDCGPLYIERFAHEKTVAVNDTATGGNAALLSQKEAD